MQYLRLALVIAQRIKYIGQENHFKYTLNTFGWIKNMTKYLSRFSDQLSNFYCSLLNIMSLIEKLWCNFRLVKMAKLLEMVLYVSACPHCLPVSSYHHHFNGAFAYLCLATWLGSFTPKSCASKQNGNMFISNMTSCHLNHYNQYLSGPDKKLLWNKLKVVFSFYLEPQNYQIIKFTWWQRRSN